MSNLTIWRPQLNHIYAMDAIALLRQLPDDYLHCIVTSPPYYGLRDYGHDEQIGLEPTPDNYIRNLVAVFREARRALRDDGTLWLNLGDSYAARNGRSSGSGTYTRGDGSGLAHMHAAQEIAAKRTFDLPDKNLMLMPHRVAMALQADGWYLRSNIIWHKTNSMPESVTDRPTNDFENLFLLSKSPQYYYDIDAIREPHKTGSIKRAMRGVSSSNKYAKDSHLPEGVHANTMSQARQNIGYANMYERVIAGQSTLSPKGRNKRAVWSISTKSYSGAHFAVMPPDLVEPCVLAGAPVDGIVHDPFAGAGTVGLVAMKHDRQWLGSELNPDYAAMANERIASADAYKHRVTDDGSVQLSLFAQGG